MALLFLLNVSFIFEFGRWTVALCRPELLLRLVEFQQYWYVLAIMEYAGASVVCASHLHSNRRNGLQPVGRLVDRIFCQCIFPWIFGEFKSKIRLSLSISKHPCWRWAHFCLVVGERATEDIQNLGFHGNDGTNTVVTFLKAHGSKLWATLWQHRCMGIDHSGATVVHHDVLSRLRGHTFQWCYTKFSRLNVNWKQFFFVLFKLLFHSLFVYKLVFRTYFIDKY